MEGRILPDRLSLSTPHGARAVTSSRVYGYDPSMHGSRVLLIVCAHARVYTQVRAHTVIRRYCLAGMHLHAPCIRVCVVKREAKVGLSCEVATARDARDAA